jgi:hypothetical protein
VIIRPGSTEGLPEIELTNLCVPADGIGRWGIPFFKGALVELTLWWLMLITWVFITNVTEEFILGLDVLQAHSTAIDFGCCVLLLDNEEMPLLELESQPYSSARISGSSKVVLTVHRVL